MREIISLNRKWAFVMEPESIPAQIPQPAYYVNLPHTWNAIDGQDGGGDYYRGTCCYVKRLTREEWPQGKRLYLEMRGANASAALYINGERIAQHDGGYATWRAEITQAAQGEEMLIVLEVSNEENERVYPQMADFTFYGGLYRDVNLIAVHDAHFDLMYFGGPGIAVTPVIKGNDADVHIHAYTTGTKSGQTIRYTILDAEGVSVSEGEADAQQGEYTMRIQNIHRWHGRKDPYLYIAVAELMDGEKVIDRVSARFGCRTFEIDPREGFILNGEPYPLRGVSRHQDRWGIGNALLPEHHREDMALICEMGANTIRLAHYQHDQLFYDLCDENGMVVWAEIPYISRHMPAAQENTLSQMRELIVQNYNHPSIVVWGLSNEITMKGAEDEDLIENHRLLNDLCHEMDKTRRTAVAALSMCPMDASYLKIPDVVSYNHYFGWYGGETDMNGPWFDRFHKEHPDVPIGCSEYGCEALNWHTSTPVQGDYTEEYQAHYHEELIRQLFSRPYIWATHVWNMFDFGADNRAEGGENGQNHKGLVTFDRKYKKDAFYAYKAWLSDEPFVHICAKRYVDRVEDVTQVKVYSNLPKVTLYVNGYKAGEQEREDHFFCFDVRNEGESRIVARAGDCRDESEIRKVDAPNEDYILREKGAVLNWFDVEQREGYLSLNDKLGDVLRTQEGKALMSGLTHSLMRGEKKAMGFDITPEMMQMLSSFTVLRMTGLMGAMDVRLTKEQLLEINAQLNQIRKPQ